MTIDKSSFIKYKATFLFCLKNKIYIFMQEPLDISLNMLYNIIVRKRN